VNDRPPSPDYWKIPEGRPSSSFRALAVVSEANEASFIYPVPALPAALPSASRFFGFGGKNASE